MIFQVIHDSSLTKNEEKDLRHRIKTIVEKINKDVEKNDDASIDSSDVNACSFRFRFPDELISVWEKQKIRDGQTTKPGSFSFVVRQRFY